jgi:cell division initiation protein
MAIKAEDLVNVQFSREFRGFNKNDVESFLLNIKDSLEEANTENVRLKNELAALNLELNRLKLLEDTLQKSLREADEKTLRILHDAQTLADKKVADATEKAASIVKNAQIESDDLMITAKAEANFLLKETNETIERLKKDAQDDVYQSELEYQSLDVAKQQLLNDLNNLLGYTNNKLSNIQTKYDPDTFNAKKQKINVLKKAKVFEPELVAVEVSKVTASKVKPKASVKAKPFGKESKTVTSTKTIAKAKPSDVASDEMDGLPTVKKIIAAEPAKPTELHQATIDVVNEIQGISAKNSFFDSL